MDASELKDTREFRDDDDEAQANLTKRMKFTCVRMEMDEYRGPHMMMV